MIKVVRDPCCGGLRKREPPPACPLWVRSRPRRKVRFWRKAAVPQNAEIAFGQLLVMSTGSRWLQPSSGSRLLGYEETGKSAALPALPRSLQLRSSFEKINVSCRAFARPAHQKRVPLTGKPPQFRGFNERVQIRGHRRIDEGTSVRGED
jgi:hypothetical protein